MTSSPREYHQRFATSGAQGRVPLAEVSEVRARFLLVSTLATAGVFAKSQIADIANLSRWAFLLTFAGVGLRTDLRQMRKQGLRPFVVGAVGEFAIAGVTLGVVWALRASSRSEGRNPFWGSVS